MDTFVVVDELARLLFRLDPGSKTTAAVTTFITDTISRWAVERGWSVRREARVGVGPATRLGYVDLVVHRGGAGPDLAIEIDSTDKPWSVDKLRHAAAAGMHPIWIRWGEELLACAYDDVDVIQLPALRVPSRGTSRSQLELWR